MEFQKTINLPQIILNDKKKNKKKTVLTKKLRLKDHSLF